MTSVPPPEKPERLTPARRALFTAIMLLIPFVLLGALELGLRVWWSAGSFPAFDKLETTGQQYLFPGRRLSGRYFVGEKFPPAPPVDLFARQKAVRALRVFVLGESSAAGFPYENNGTFSRVVQHALRDALPGDSVEVVNVGIAATNSFTIVDLTRDILEQRPDAILIYAGHNEYYGALGVGSAIHGLSSPALVRLSLSALRLRSGVLVRRAVAAATGAVRGHSGPADSAVATFMETVARDQEIPLDGPVFRAGLNQFGENIGLAVRRFREAGVPVFIGSVASNIRHQPPFASPANGPARAAFDSATRLVATGDSIRARSLFERARDLDVIRFRAPSALNDTIRAVAKAAGAVYVPVQERIAAASPGGVAGQELFLEHVHLNQHGYALVARAFAEAIGANGWLGRNGVVERLADWDAYEEAMALTSFDERIVTHTVRTVSTRWPFVARGAAVDYRGRYRPMDAADSLALLVSRGGLPWADAKQRVAVAHEAEGRIESAIAEHRGLLRAFPLAEPPYRNLGRLLARQGRSAEAVPYLERALSLAPTSEASYHLGVIALAAKDYPRAIAILDSAVTLDPKAVAPLYQLSLAFGLSKNLGPARAAAERAARLDPKYPGLAPWMTVLGIRGR